MTDVPVSLPAGVHLRGSVYHLRIGVPDDVRHLWPRQGNGKFAVDAYRKSLGTSNRNEAAAKAHAIIADYQKRFARLLAESQPKPYTPITDELVAYIVQKTEQQILALDDVLRRNPEYFAQWYGARKWRGYLTGEGVNPKWESTGRSVTPQQFEDVMSIHDSITHDLQADLAMGHLEAAEQQANLACAALASTIRVDWTNDEGRSTLQKVLRAMVRAWKGVRERNRGEPVETPSDPVHPIESALAVAAPAMPATTLRDIVPSWTTRTSAKPNAISRAQHALRLFEEAVGVLPLHELSKSIGAKFVRFLLDESARGFGRKTANNHAAAISALMNVAVRDDLIERNPFDLSIDTTIGAKKRVPWTDEQLRLMLSAPLFSPSMGLTPEWEDVDPSDGRATLLILLHTGARIGEIAQLRREDFQSHSGIMSIRIAPEAGKLKTQASDRVVPLAEHLLEDPWFAGWLNAVIGGTGPAFPSAAGRVRGPGDTMGQWFRQFRENVGLPPGPLEGAHKFRHWIRAALAEAGVNTETADSITGHEPTGSSGRTKYTPTASMGTMKKALDRLIYPQVFNGSNV